jgi:hypothetical protein
MLEAQPANDNTKVAAATIVLPIPIGRDKDNVWVWWACGRCGDNPER